MRRLRLDYQAMTLDNAPTPDKVEQPSVPKLSGQHGKASMVLLNVPVSALPKDDLHLSILTQISKQLAAREDRPGVPKMKLRCNCRSCQSELKWRWENQQKHFDNHHMHEFVISHPEFTAFEIQVKSPAVLCASCGTKNIIASYMAEDIIEALDKALISL